MHGKITRMGITRGGIAGEGSLDLRDTLVRLHVFEVYVCVCVFVKKVACVWLYGEWVAGDSEHTSCDVGAGEHSRAPQCHSE